MELNEAVRRIFGRHLVLIVTFVVIGMAIATAMHVGDPRLYQATTRFVIGTDDPTTQEASQAIADTARGIATGPSIIQQALTELGVSRDPYDIARHHLSVEPLGSSGVLALTVTDPDPHVAVALADKLASLVVAARDQIDGSGSTDAITRLQQEDAQITDRIQHVSDQIRQLDTAIASASGSARASSLASERSRLSAMQASLSSQQAAIQSESANLTTQDALQPRASIVEPASLAPDTVPSGLVPDALLGALLGLLVGVTIAACLEIFRPSIVGRAALEREMGAPVLAQIPGRLTSVDRLDRPAVTMHLDMAAASNDVRRVSLIGAERDADLTQLAQFLTTSEPAGIDGEVAVGLAESYARPMNGSGPNGHGRMGIVLVTPNAVLCSDLQLITDTLTFSRYPLVGIITYDLPRLRGRARNGQPNQTADPKADPEPEQEADRKPEQRAGTKG